MPLFVLVFIVVIGLAIVIAAVHFFGGARPGSLDDNTVRKAWQREFGKVEIKKIVISSDRLAACVVLQEPDRLGLVCQMGAHHIARCLRVGSARDITENREPTGFAFERYHVESCQAANR